jgi:hypothetical protein
MKKVKKMAMGGMGDMGAAAAAARSKPGMLPPRGMPAMPPRDMPPPQGMAGMQGLGQAMGSMPPRGMPPPAGPAQMQGLGQAMIGNPQMAQNLGKVGSATMGGMGMKKGGKVSSASSRADGCATKGKTKGRFV